MRDFNHTVNVLVKAYLNDTLEHTTCAACAVGNMIADAMGCTIKENDFDESGLSRGWYKDGQYVERLWLNAMHYTCDRGYVQSYGHEVGIKQILSTGYTVKEIWRIERAFEGAGRGDSLDEWMFNGLMSVVDVLAEIHGVDLSVKEQAKALFSRTPINH